VSVYDEIRELIEMLKSDEPVSGLSSVQNAAILNSTRYAVALGTTTNITSGSRQLDQLKAPFSIERVHLARRAASCTSMKHGIVSEDLSCSLLPSLD
jgi:hypothetical protein